MKTYIEAHSEIEAQVFLDKHGDFGFELYQLSYACAVSAMAKTLDCDTSDIRMVTEDKANTILSLSKTLCNKALDEATPYLWKCKLHGWTASVKGWKAWNDKNTQAFYRQCVGA